MEKDKGVGGLVTDKSKRQQAFLYVVAITLTAIGVGIWVGIAISIITSHPTISLVAVVLAVLFIARLMFFIIETELFFKRNFDDGPVVIVRGELKKITTSAIKEKFLCLTKKKP